MKDLVERYNKRDGQILVSNDDVINEFIDSLSDEAQRILDDLQKDANEFKKWVYLLKKRRFMTF